MAIKFRIFIRKLLIVVNLVLAFIFILACLAPYLNPVKWWFISWLGLIFPILLFLSHFLFIQTYRLTDLIFEILFCYETI